MITAKEAREIAIKQEIGEGTLLEHLINPILEIIKDAALAGKFSATVHGEMYQAVRDKLIEFEYDVTSTSVEGMYTWHNISW